MRAFGWIPVLVLFAAGPLAAQGPEVARPSLVNMDELSRLVRSETPAQLRQAGLGTTVRLSLFVADTGTVDTVRVVWSSGLTPLDGAARRLGARAKFQPAMVGGVPVSRWVELPVTFPHSGAGPELVSVQVQNRDSAQARLQAEYPEMLRRAKLGAAVGIALDLDEIGNPRRATIAHSSCFADLDALVMGMALSLPLVTGDSTATPRRTLLTLSFTRGDTLRLHLMGDADPPPPPDSVRQRRQQMQRDVEARRPELRNRSAVQRALVSNYPQRERDAGIGGEPVIWFFIDERGTVQYRTVSKSSGNCALDVAALAVADVMRFRPATSDGEPVGVWVEIPIIFRSS